MTEQYIRVLKESLCRKKEILEELIRLSEGQAQQVNSEKTDWVEFDRYTEQKLVLIEELNKLDEGFELVFERVKEELSEHTQEYAEDVLFLKKCIKMVTDLSTSLQALEYRNKASIEQRFMRDKRELGERRISAKAVSTYYQNAKGINYVESQLLDRKK